MITLEHLKPIPEGLIVYAEYRDEQTDGAVTMGTSRLYAMAYQPDEDYWVFLDVDPYEGFFDPHDCSDFKGYAIGEDPMFISETE